MQCMGYEQKTQTPAKIQTERKSKRKSVKSVQLLDEYLHAHIYILYNHDRCNKCAGRVLNEENFSQVQRFFSSFLFFTVAQTTLNHAHTQDCPPVIKLSLMKHRKHDPTGQRASGRESKWTNSATTLKGRKKGRRKREGGGVETEEGRQGGRKAKGWNETRSQKDEESEEAITDWQIGDIEAIPSPGRARLR